MSIRRKFITIVLAVSIIPISISGFVVYHHCKASLMKSLENQLESTAAVEESRINLLFDRFTDDVKMIANRPNLKEHFVLYGRNRDNQSREILDKILNELTGTVPIFHEISLVATNGEIIYSTDSSQIVKHVDNERLLTKGLKECGIVDTIKDKYGSSPDIWLSCPMLVGGSTIGIVSAVLDGKFLTEITGDYTGLGKTGETVLAKRDESGGALFIVPLRHNKDAAFIHKIPKDNVSVLITQALLKRQRVFSSYVDYRGKNVIGITRYIERADWGIVVKVDKDEFMEPLARLRNFLIIGYLILTGFIALTLVYLVGHITGPLTYLTKTASRISEGDFSQRIEISHDGEIGVLSTTFNHMLDTIWAQHTSLEDKFTELHAIVDTLPGVFFIFDKQGKILMWNSNFVKISGYKPDEMARMSLGDFFPKDNKPLVYKTFQSALTVAKADKELLLQTKDKKKIPYYFIFSLIHSNTEDNIVSIGVDITERVMMENELVEYRHHLKKLVDQKSLEIIEMNKQLQQEVEKRAANENELKEKEEFLRLVTDSLPALVGYIDVESRYLFANKLYEQWFGYCRDEIIGKTRKEILGQDYDDTTKDYMLTALSGQKVEFDNSIALNDGAIKIIAVKYTPHVNEKDGNVNGVFVMAHDITQLKHAELALRESEERFRRIFEDSPVGIAVTDRNGYFTKVNNAMCKMLGYTEAEFKTLTHHKLTHKEHLDELAKLMKEKTEALLPSYKMEKHYVRKNGEVIWVNVIANFIRDDKGGVAYGISMVENISHRKEAERELNVYTG
ncbi:MAG: PAS domain S-box protein, partial [Nitrospirae bacterium]|nr:PAS domain S-box protein [Nitrospirota bacterium]